MKKIVWPLLYPPGVMIMGNILLFNIAASFCGSPQTSQLKSLVTLLQYSHYYYLQLPGLNQKKANVNIKELIGWKG